ncbi:MAG: hypothetical protein D6729_01790 [Deltaproteobacteria bacterium]|nr:MAG: hypothetical protein D6729_01790 [Deltaproteobacteria bacterium]
MIDIPFFADAAKYLGAALSPAGELLEGAVEALTGNAMLGDLASLGLNLSLMNWPAAVADVVEVMGDVAAGEQAIELPSPDVAYAEAADGYSDDEEPPEDAPAPAEGRPRGHPAEPASRHEAVPVGTQVVGEGFQRQVDEAIRAHELIAPYMRLRAILNDASLPLEEKIAMVFAEIQDQLDAKIEKKMEEVAQADGDASNKLTQELQLLVQKRERMTTLSTNLSRMMNDMSMRVLQNIS